MRPRPPRASTSPPELWERLRARCEVVEVELRVGLDTFRPVAADTLDEHEMHSEAYRVEPAARAAILAAAGGGRRVGLHRHDVRARRRDGRRSGGPGRGADVAPDRAGLPLPRLGALLTNFHLPRSTLLALVMAFCGVDETRRIYAEAIRERYRFYSFGDASLLLP